ncbi:hypothetical protein [Clostridium cylindrosporum]|uniref:N(6)-L-threonylcarbamoyladenine synthase n=1 Tax=Clostridium cylindrosporum DSM 605 TaxID=1121307 RepID=A0A0J8DAK0_CLOCY|nr:hypothetical protein [Clostridium cylindrosporum]KMT21349.1 tRNA N6-adenosine threonylcarbamoyltransferase [Clostridium cylindrosporum DSM 605]
MANVLGIDTSNYTTSIAIYSDDGIIEDRRKLLTVSLGKRGLRQSDALFEHIKNMPSLLEGLKVYKLDAVAVSTKPRPIEGSYMPVFLAGESIAKSIANLNNIPLLETTHQEGHLEAALNSISLNFNNFIAIHISGGTTEVLNVKNNEIYNIDIIGGTKDISIGQFIDRTGVGLGHTFPAGTSIDKLALKVKESNLRIPSKVEGLFMNFSGQETKAHEYISLNYNSEDISYAVMLCISKTLQKVCLNIQKLYDLPIVFMGGVSSSKFLKEYFKRNKFNNVYFARGQYGCDNAVGVAKIGYKKIVSTYK